MNEIGEASQHSGGEDTDVGGGEASQHSGGEDVEEDSEIGRAHV